MKLRPFGLPTHRGSSAEDPVYLQFMRFAVIYMALLMISVLIILVSAVMGVL